MLAVAGSVSYRRIVMRVPTSVYSVEAALGKAQYEEIAIKYAQDVGKPLEGERMGWHWVLCELDAPMPKSATGLLKSHPIQHLAIGLSRGRYGLRLNAKPEIGKVWVSEFLPGCVAPVEVAKALQRRSAPSAGGKWTGLMIELYMPMHQKHPGLAEHAVIGGVRTVAGDVFCFLSDRPDPLSATLWHIFRMHSAKRVGQAMLNVVDKAGQRDFRCTLVGQELSLRDCLGVKLSESEIRESLLGVKRFVWKTDAMPASPIPQNARKFKLGEELSAQESKSMPIAAFLGGLDALVNR